MMNEPIKNTNAEELTHGSLLFLFLLLLGRVVLWAEEPETTIGFEPINEEGKGCRRK